MTPHDRFIQVRYETLRYGARGTTPPGRRSWYAENPNELSDAACLQLLIGRAFFTVQLYNTYCESSDAFDRMIRHLRTGLRRLARRTKSGSTVTVRFYASEGNTKIHRFEVSVGNEHYDYQLPWVAPIGDERLFAQVTAEPNQ